MMSTVLLLEASTETGSVAIARGGVVVADLSFSSRDPGSRSRTEALAPAVASCLALANMSPSDISAVVCGAGPGGFTSLRSAAALAKGLCSALGIPLYAVSSLEVLAWSAVIPEGRFVVALHAGRNEWFAADVDCDANRAISVSAAYLAGDDELRTRAERSQARLIGLGLDYDATPRAAAIVPRLAEIERDGAVDLDSWEPTYGRLAEAQVRWEAAHGRPLAV